MTRFELERDIDHQLRRLAAPQAPPTLVPRVLAATGAWRDRPWYARAWRTWPAAWQAASAAAVVAFFVATALALPAIDRVLAPSASALAPFTSAVGDRLAVVQTAASNIVGVSRVLWRAIVQPLAPFAFAIAVFMCAMCAACALALTRVVAERTFRP